MVYERNCGSGFFQIKLCAGLLLHGLLLSEGKRIKYIAVSNIWDSFDFSKAKTVTYRNQITVCKFPYFFEVDNYSSYIFKELALNEEMIFVFALNLCEVFNTINFQQQSQTKMMHSQSIPSHVRVTVGELFGKYDVNQKGELGRNEIKMALSDIYKRLGILNMVTQGDVDNFIDDYDTNHDGKLSWSDFMNMYALNFYKSYERQHLPEEISLSIDEIFARYDHDNNGILDFEELEECLQSVFDRMGVKAKSNMNDVMQFFKDYDTNGDGKISKDDFKKVYAINFHSF